MVPKLGVRYFQHSKKTAQYTTSIRYILLGQPTRNISQHR